MEKINAGDLVARKSYNYDVLFKVKERLNQPHGGSVCILKGVNMRIVADAPIEDLELQTDMEIERFEKKNRDIITKSMDTIKSSGPARAGKKSIRKFFLYRGEKSFSRPGRVLHIDGDKDYLEMCMAAYREMGIDVMGKHVPENRQPREVTGMLKEFLPDILVLTGHDALRKDKSIYDIANYKNSAYYAAAVQEARRFEPSYDDLIIFAGACQSYFEAILDAGANYASSPKRILIHALDPVFVCQKVAYTGIDSIVSVEELISKTITGLEGMGGLQTRGKYREGMPGPDGSIG